MRKLFNNVGSGLLTFIALDGYRRAVINDKKNSIQTKSLKSLEETKNEFEKAAKVLQEQENGLDINKVDAVASLGRLQEKLETVNQNIVSHTQAVSSGNINTVTNSSESVQISLFDAIKEMQSLINKFASSSSSRSGTNSINYDLFSNYSTAELGAIAHIIASIFILYTFFNILLIIYGDALIVYLDLEKKYPSMVKFIQLRRKFQNYYLKVASIIICCVLSFIIYINLLVLI